jgi:fructose 5-dehydrogenase small subunit
MTTQTPNLTRSSLLSRRNMLLATATLFAGGLMASSCPVPTFASSDPTLRASFMRLSQRLVNHQLDPDVGARIAEAAMGMHTDFNQMVSAIIAIADERQAVTVEDFFADIPDGKLKDFAHWVIFAWYSGCSSEKRDAVVFTYEEALTFKTTADVVTIPSFGLSGPNRWSQATLPLANMPRF